MTTIIIIVVVALVFFVTVCVVTFMVWKREAEMRADCRDTAGGADTFAG